MRITQAKKPDYEMSEAIAGVKEAMRNAANPVRRRTLSVACISAGEASVFDMIKSVEEIADEIIIIHSGEIWKNVPNVQWHYRKWNNDFGAARNESFQHCTKDYILWLDSDDILPVETARLIRAALDNPGPKTLEKMCYFCLPVQNTNEHGHPSGITQARVTPNYPWVTWKGRIHETHAESLRKSNLTPVIIENGFVLHSGYQNHEDLVQKIQERNIPMLKNEPASAMREYHLAQSYMILEEWDAALERYYDIEENYDNLEDEFRECVTYNISVCLFKLKRYDLAEDSFSLAENIPESFYYLGLIDLIHHKNYYTAQIFLEKYLEIPVKPSQWGSNRIQCRYFAWNNLGALLLKPFLELQKKAQKEFPKPENKNVLQKQLKM